MALVVFLIQRLKHVTFDNSVPYQIHPMKPKTYSLRLTSLENNIIV